MEEKNFRTNLSMFDVTSETPTTEEKQAIMKYETEPGAFTKNVSSKMLESNHFEIPHG